MSLSRLKESKGCATLRKSKILAKTSVIAQSLNLRINIDKHYNSKTEFRCDAADAVLMNESNDKNIAKCRNDPTIYNALKV